MRDDMAKMLVETHRIGGHQDSSRSKRARDKNKDLENLPQKESVRKPYRDRKFFDENFPPLLGFLRKNCGRNWDKVQSELVAGLKGGSAVIEHVKMHLYQDFLTEKPFWIDGKLHYYSFGRPMLVGPDRFYVDRQGRLQEGRKDKRRKSRQNIKTRVRISELEDYRKLDGVWYHVWYRRLSESEDSALSVSDKIRYGDVVAKILGHKYPHIETLHGLNQGRKQTAIRAVRISKKEIRAEGLNQQTRKG